MKFTLIAETPRAALSEWPSDELRVEVSVVAESLSDLLPAMEQFLRGCGFNPCGTLEFVECEPSDS